MHALLLNTSSIGEGGAVGEPEEFTDSDTDPVWTPQEEDVSVDCLLPPLAVSCNTFLTFPRVTMARAMASAR